MIQGRRKNIRLTKEEYQIPSQIFTLTICTWDRRLLFQNETWSKLVLTSLGNGPMGEKTDRYAYCLMPDHLHLSLSPMGSNLVDLINRWKSFSANLLREEGVDGPCWQRGFYDHALRKEEDIRSVVEYIVNNPVRADIVTNWVDYSFSWHRWM